MATRFYPKFRGGIVEAECNCLYGTPVIDANGNCLCDNDVPGGVSPQCPPDKPLWNGMSCWDGFGVSNPSDTPLTPAIPTQPEGAPSGYRYIWNGMSWVLVRLPGYATGTLTPGQTTTGTPVTVQNLTSQFQAFYANNKMLVLVAAAGLLYLATKK